MDERFKRFASSLSAIALAVISTATMVAQQAGTVSGTVSDTMGTGIPRSTVVLKNESTNAVTKIAGDDQGHYTSPALPAGNYTMEASASGFALATKKSVAVSADHPAQVDLTLEVGSVMTQITVEASSSDSVAAQYAPLDGLLEARSARTEVNSAFIQNFLSTVADSTETM